MVDSSTISQQCLTTIPQIPNSLPSLILEANKLPTKSVVVYQDRAEVKRTILAQKPEPGRMLVRVNVRRWNLRKMNKYFRIECFPNDCPWIHSGGRPTWGNHFGGGIYGNAAIQQQRWGRKGYCFLLDFYEFLQIKKWTKVNLLSYLIYHIFCA